MADPIFFKIFLSSPGDVQGERDDAQAVIDEINGSGEFKHHYMLKLYRWDDKDTTLPMAATDTPQTSVDTYLTLPSRCDLVVVIFWSRMGTPIIMDGREYLSGTHYEYAEALDGHSQRGKPKIWLYRCTEPVRIDLTDPQRDDRIKQFDRVVQFFKGFVDAEGRFTAGVNLYPAHADFRSMFKNQLLEYLRHLRDKPRQPDSPPKRTVDPNLIPYRGLTALDEGDARIFFGRDAETLEVLSRVDQQRLVFVLGASGSGKSSLVAAGVLPKLRERGWQIVRCVPGDDPFYAVALALVTQIPEFGVKPIDYLSAARQLANTLRDSPADLNQQIALTLPGKRVLLFIDQFEELFTLADKNPHLPAGSVAAFIQAIRQPSAQVVTLLTMRADFYGSALPHFDELKQHAYGLTRPSPFALYEMITRPAELAGLKLDEGLAAQIVEDAGSESGALALISYVLESLYLRARARGDGKLTRHDYAVELQGVRGAINTLAERAYAELPFDEAVRQKALQAVFRELIALTEEDGQMIPTRRRAPLTTFNADSNEAQLVETFVRARLLVKDDRAVEVAHEALFHSWNRLRDWIVEAHEDLILLRQVRAAAREWHSRNQRPAFLWPQERLELVYEMLRRLRPELDPLVLEFIRPEQEWLLLELGSLETTHARRRDIGDRLAVIGDTRFGMGVKDGVPEIAWLLVAPSGEIMIEKHKFMVQPFYIAQYQITYAQFQTFLDEPDGFEDDRWWEGMPDKYKKQTIKQQRIKISNAPRDSVSWYQSVAFARWLDAKYREQDIFAHFRIRIPNGMFDEDGDATARPYETITLNPNQWQIRLPTEWEWQWMAQNGAEVREYPWGKWDQCPRANTIEAGISERSTAVGVYPHGAAECGALDAAGNLFEWCMNDKKKIDQVCIIGEEYKALRGGSFNSARYRTAASYRHDYAYPSIGYHSFGVRLVMSSPMRL